VLNLGYRIKGRTEVEEGAGIEYCAMEFQLSHVNGTGRWSSKAEIRGVQWRNKIKIEWNCSKRINLICNNFFAAQIQRYEMYWEGG